MSGYAEEECGEDLWERAPEEECEFGEKHVCLLVGGGNDKKCNKNRLNPAQLMTIAGNAVIECGMIPGEYLPFRRRFNQRPATKEIRMKKLVLLAVIVSSIAIYGCVDMRFQDPPFKVSMSCPTGYVPSTKTACPAGTIEDNTCLVLEDETVCVAYVPDSGSGDGINCKGGYVTASTSEAATCVDMSDMTEEEIEAWDYSSDGFMCVDGSISGKKCRKVPDDDPNDADFPIISGQRCSAEQLNPDAATTVRIHIIDVGNGDAIWIQTPSGKNVLVDGGDTGYYGVTSGGPIVVDYLSAHGFDTGSVFDAVFLTHPHADHFGGFSTIFKSYGLRNYIDPMDLDTTEAVPAAYTKWITTMENMVGDVNHIYMPASEVFAGKAEMPSEFFGDGVKAEYIFSRKEFVSANGDTNNVNTASIIFKLTYGTRSFIFTGDATNVDESAAISAASKSGISLTTNFLKVCHHGSDTSSTTMFLDTIFPGSQTETEKKDRGAFISSGRRLYSGTPTQRKAIVDRIRAYVPSENFLSTAAGDSGKEGDVNAVRDDNILVVIKSDGSFYACYSGTN